MIVRWNVEKTEDGLRVCRGEHETTQDCMWEYYVPRTLLAVERPVPTREAVEEWYHKEYPKVLEDNPGWIGVILAALSHFAPPAPQLPPICRMSVEEIEAEMLISIQEKNRRMEGVLYVQDCARVAHRLAQPVPKVDPDAEAKRWEQKLAKITGASVLGDQEWRDPSPENIEYCEFWRAVAAAKEAGRGT